MGSIVVIFYRHCGRAKPVTASGSRMRATRRQKVRRLSIVRDQEQKCASVSFVAVLFAEKRNKALEKQAPTAETKEHRRSRSIW